MTSEEKLRCCGAVLEFLEEDVEEANPPKLVLMNDVLTKYFGNNSMPLFTEYINQELSMGYTIINKGDFYKPFFAKQSVKFYQEALREIKIKEIINI